MLAARLSNANLETISEFFKASRRVAQQLCPEMPMADGRWPISQIGNWQSEIGIAPLPPRRCSRGATLSSHAQPAELLLPIASSTSMARTTTCGCRRRVHQFPGATIEAWVKWRDLAPVLACSTSARQREMYIGISNEELTPLGGDEVPDGGHRRHRRRVEMCGGFRINEWAHLAVVTGPGGVRLYLVACS
jgi:hypothetical protein